MKKALIVALLLGQTASQAAALSCGPLNPAQRFNHMQSLPETYVIGLGSLQQMSAVPIGRQVEPRRYEFSGQFLGADKIEARAERVMVTLTLQCKGPWCGDWPDPLGPQSLVILQQDGPDYAMVEGPCPWNIRPYPTEAQQDALRRCIRNGSCGPDELSLFTE